MFVALGFTRHLMRVDGFRDRLGADAAVDGADEVIAVGLDLESDAVAVMDRPMHLDRKRVERHRAGIDLADQPARLRRFVGDEGEVEPAGKGVARRFAGRRIEAAAVDRDLVQAVPTQAAVDQLFPFCRVVPVFRIDVGRVQDHLFELGARHVRFGQADQHHALAFFQRLELVVAGVGAARYPQSQ